MASVNADFAGGSENAATPTPPNSKPLVCFVASYTTLPNGQLHEPAQIGKGISIFSVDRETGKMTALDGKHTVTDGSGKQTTLILNGVVETPDPSFFALSKNNQYLYVANETLPTGSVTAYRVEKEAFGRISESASTDGLAATAHSNETADSTTEQPTQNPSPSQESTLNFLTKINEVKSGGATCSAALNSSGTQLACANYCGGNVCLFNIREEDGGLEDCCEWLDFKVAPAVTDGSEHQKRNSDTDESTISLMPHLGPNRGRQEASHPHMVRFAPGNDELLLVPDLGCDCIRTVVIINNPKREVSDGKCKHGEMREVADAAVEIVAEGDEDVNHEERKDFFQRPICLAPRLPKVRCSQLGVGPRHLEFHSEMSSHGVTTCYILNELGHFVSAWRTAAPASVSSEPFCQYPGVFKSDETAPRRRECEMDGKKYSLHGSLCEEVQQVSTLPGELLCPDWYQYYHYNQPKVCASPPSPSYDLSRLPPASPASREDLVPRYTSADIHLSPDGRYLYTSQRGHDSIRLFRVGVNPVTKKVDLRYGLREGGWQPVGKTPRGFDITPCGKFLMVAGMNSHRVDTFRINLDDSSKDRGKLEKTGFMVEVNAPQRLQFMEL